MVKDASSQSFDSPLLLPSLVFAQDGQYREKHRCVATYGALVLFGMISQGFRAWAKLVRPRRGWNIGVLEFACFSIEWEEETRHPALWPGVSLFYIVQGGAIRKPRRASARRACTVRADISLVRRGHERECSEKVIHEYINRSGRSKEDWNRRICRRAWVTGTSGWSDACLPYRSGAGRG
jgi:hypothetical protein